MADKNHIHNGDSFADDQRQITLVDDQGNEELFEVLFTFDSEDYGKSYVLLYPAGAKADEEIEIQAFSFTPDEDGYATAGDLYPIEDDAEWDMVEEVLNTFMADNEDDEDDE
ncbi:DUF1292 domain-containing protein [Schleiferilactobacillus harbinensis]|jgi:uncharacterized protein YrzB (UPF0473 family)|uniref:UPF0473 protein D1010_11420 n=2 Tax=Schleiferilactobacillus harbinensis TaxID=304207 RepID=A0A510TX74_9LACO|nr:DUF1292 domain-containing protein [Schleiferilactobacillus harbinensis]HAY53643.1 DUF1292 domain-containing protein [Lactobacillus sp.]KRM23546.1 hypothetical protein FC91_GL001659 [Schleiferilactobacillus harbinensis DSM 16991]MBO3092243.1 DUF1292 domain-containing protein [Schleiferilactobacillus harbinensis]MCI1850313.1 DUF1292 domain-containing protein [Schleiferilactobacillus harbinensis]MCT2908891.1 DUF1292 domain-containing protein [Schleiferilactobacillus harbinensis]